MGSGPTLQLPAAIRYKVGVVMVLNFLCQHSTGVHEMSAGWHAQRQLHNVWAGSAAACSHPLQPNTMLGVVTAQFYVCIAQAFIHWLIPGWHAQRQLHKVSAGTAAACSYPLKMGCGMCG
jgi:hypothetical protein